MTSVLEFKRPAPAQARFFWSVTFECTADEVLSVQVSGAGDSREDKLRTAQCLRYLAEDIEALANGAQAE